MADTLNLLRTCRIFNYEFAAATNILALENEFIQINRIPMASQFNYADLIKEVSIYKNLAEVEQAKLPGVRLNHWDLWLTYALSVPLLYIFEI